MPVWHETSDTAIPVLVKNYQPELDDGKDTAEALDKIDWRAGKFVQNKNKEGNSFNPGDIVYHKVKEVYVKLEKPEGENRT